jgi:hypothetical protein
MLQEQMVPKMKDPVQTAMQMTHILVVILCTPCTDRNRHADRDGYACADLTYLGAISFGTCARAAPGRVERGFVWRGVV